MTASLPVRQHPIFRLLPALLVGWALSPGRLAALIAPPPAFVGATPGIPRASGTGPRQEPAPPGFDAGSAIVYLVTFGPGPRVWERFGHNAIWFRDSLGGDGPAYDFGRFDFDEPGFVLNFARGRMFYWMGRDPGAALINWYVGQGRSAWLQRLALVPEARVRLRDSLEAQLGRDRGRYRYDYYRDNCSTRVRDAIDLAVGGAVRAQLDAATGGNTYRLHTRRSFEGSLPVYAGVMIALGPSVDRPISAWQESFLPGELQRHLRDVTVTGVDGVARPLVSAEVTIAESDAFLVPEHPGRGPILLFPALGVGLGLGLALLGRRGRSRAAARRGFLSLAGLWALAAAILGLVLLWFWGFTDHLDAHRNANVFQFNLLALALLVGLSRAAAGTPQGAKSARVWALTALVAACLGPGIEWLVGWGQQNAEVAGLAVPAYLGVYLGLAGWGASAPVPFANPPGPR